MLTISEKLEQNDPQIVEKDASGTVTSTKNFVWNGMAVSEERDASNNVTKRFYGQGEQMVVSGSATNYYFTKDHLGSVREMTDSSGTIHASYSYDPYGRSTKVAGDLEADFGFTGHYKHLPSGLLLAPYRAYNPDLGRWISRDPIAEKGGLNLYGYVFNDPINGIDPLGQSFWSVVGYAAAGVLVGVATTALIVAAAPVIGAVAVGALVTVGVEASTAGAIVTGGAFLAAGAGAVLTVKNVENDVGEAQQTGNWNKVAFDAGNIVGAAGYTTSLLQTTGGDFNVGGFDPDYDGLVTAGQMSPWENFVNWLGTMPTQESSSAVSSFSAMGIDTSIKLDGCP